jgi:hypothetical protein
VSKRKNGRSKRRKEDKGRKEMIRKDRKDHQNKDGTMNKKFKRKE